MPQENFLNERDDDGKYKIVSVFRIHVNGMGKKIDKYSYNPHFYSLNSFENVFYMSHRYNILCISVILASTLFT